MLEEKDGTLLRCGRDEAFVTQKPDGLKEPEARPLDQGKGHPGIHREIASLWSPESILSFADVYGHLLPQFLELQANNRIRLLVSQAFSWLPNGPIQRFFNQQAHNEFCRSRFDRPGEFMVVVNGMFSQRSSTALVQRLKRIAKEFSEVHDADVHLPLGERTPMSLLVAIRHWELQAFAELRRRRR